MGLSHSRNGGHNFEHLYFVGEQSRLEDIPFSAQWFVCLVVRQGMRLKFSNREWLSTFYMLILEVGEVALLRSSFWIEFNVISCADWVWIYAAVNWVALFARVDNTARFWHWFNWASIFTFESVSCSTKSQFCAKSEISSCYCDQFNWELENKICSVTPIHCKWIG